MGNQRQILNERKETVMKVKTSVKAGGMSIQHNQTVARGLKVKTNVKAGHMSQQHNQTVASGLKFKTGVKAGSTPSSWPSSGPPGLTSKP